MRYTVAPMQGVQGNPTDGAPSPKAPGEPTAPKRRGRPKGVKNRTALERERPDGTSPRSATSDSQRRRLVDAAISILPTTGLSGLNVEQVTDQASVGRQTFYAHFQTRAELLLAVHSELARRVFGGFDSALRTGNSASESVCAAMTIVLDFVATRPHEARFVLVEAPALGGAHVPIVRTFFDALASILVLGSLRSEAAVPLSPRAASILINGLCSSATALIDDRSHAAAPMLLPDFRLLLNAAVGA